MKKQNVDPLVLIQTLDNAASLARLNRQETISVATATELLKEWVKDRLAQEGQKDEKTEEQ